MTQFEKPSFVTEEMLIFLDNLRNSGQTNMYGARPYIQDSFDLSAQDAAKVLVYWMETYTERHELK